MSLLKEIRKKWKKRSGDSHKGDFGKVLIIAGAKGYTGAAHLCAEACVRSGAGLVTLAVPDAVYPILARRSAEVMVKPFPSTRQGSFSLKALPELADFSKTQDVIAMGPGLTQNPETQKLIRAFITKTHHQPLVIDADGLNALKGHLDILSACRDRAVLTPHAGEFSRLFNVKLSNDQKKRKALSLQLSRRHRVIILLKGNRTVVASPEGNIYVNLTGNPGMASGGSGDVLTGIIAALLGQGFSVWDAARFAAFVHGKAGDAAAANIGQIGMTASDIIKFLPLTYKHLLGW